MPADVQTQIAYNRDKIAALKAEREELIRRNRSLQMAAANKAATQARKERARMLIQLGLLVVQYLGPETWQDMRADLVDRIAAAQEAAKRYAANGRDKDAKKASKAAKDKQIAVGALDILIGGGTID